MDGNGIFIARREYGVAGGRETGAAPAGLLLPLEPPRPPDLGAKPSPRSLRPIFAASLLCHCAVLATALLTTNTYRFEAAPPIETAIEVQVESPPSVSANAQPPETPRMEAPSAAPLPEQIEPAAEQPETAAVAAETPAPASSEPPPLTGDVVAANETWAPAPQPLQQADRSQSTNPRPENIPPDPTIAEPRAEPAQPQPHEPSRRLTEQNIPGVPAAAPSPRPPKPSPPHMIARPARAARVAPQSNPDARQEAERAARRERSDAALAAKREPRSHSDGPASPVAARRPAPTALERPAGQGTTQSPAAAPINAGAYRQSVIGRLIRFIRYPESARTRGVNGQPSVSFSLDGAGQVTSVVIARSSGQADLDAEALAMVRRAAPFAAPPPGVPRTITTTIAFKLR